MKFVRFLASALKWTALHFLACTLIVPATLKAGAAGSGITELLTLMTKVLYFPILGLALYPRHLFPGYWIYVPIALNSLVWGGCLTLVLQMVRHLLRKSQPDA